MNKRNGNTLTSHFIFRGLKEFCSYSFMLFRRFHIKSVKKGFRGISCFGISNTTYHSVIFIDCNSIVRFEFVTAVLSDFNDFNPKERNKKTVEFIEEKWRDYTSEFALDKLDSDTQEILVKTILARIIYQSSTINCMKEKNLI